MLHFSDNLLTKPKTTVHLTGLNPHTNLWSHALQHLMKHGSSSTAKTFSLFTQKIKLIDHMVHILLSCSKCKWTAGTEGMWQNQNAQIEAYWIKISFQVNPSKTLHQKIRNFQNCANFIGAVHDIPHYHTDVL